MQITVNVPDQADAHAKALASFYAAGKAALKDGWQPGTDVPAILTAAVINLMPFFQNLDLLLAEIKSQPLGCALALEVELAKVI